MPREKDDDAEKESERKSEALVLSHANALPRLQALSEMRPVPMTRTGTSLGVGGPTPGVSDESDPFDDGGDFSSEDIERLDRMLGQLGDQPNLRARERPSTGGTPHDAASPTAAADDSVRALSSQAPRADGETPEPQRAFRARLQRKHLRWIAATVTLAATALLMAASASRSGRVGDAATPPSAATGAGSAPSHAPALPSPTGSASTPASATIPVGPSHDESTPTPHVARPASHDTSAHPLSPVATPSASAASPTKESPHRSDLKAPPPSTSAGRALFDGEIPAMTDEMKVQN